MRDACSEHRFGNSFAASSDAFITTYAACIQEEKTPENYPAGPYFIGEAESLKTVKPLFSLN